MRSDLGLPRHSSLNAFIATAKSVLAATDAGIFSSINGGQGWVETKPPTDAPIRVVSLATLDEISFAGTDRLGLLESRDHGGSWRISQSFPAEAVRSMHSHSGTIYVGTDTEGVFASTNNGLSWNHLLHGLAQHAQIFSLATVKCSLFAGPYSKGLYKWEERLRRWSKTGDATPLALAATGGSLVAGHNPGGIQYSLDSGTRWARATPRISSNPHDAPGHPSEELLMEAPVWDLASGAGMVFAGTGPGIYYSNDKGATWARAQIGLPTISPGTAFLVREDFILAAIFTRLTEAP